MTASDPAVAAAERAWQKRTGATEPDRYFAIDRRHYAEVAAAREALAPIREVLDSWKAATNCRLDLPAYEVVATLLDDLDEYVYPQQEEL